MRERFGKKLISRGGVESSPALCQILVACKDEEEEKREAGAEREIEVEIVPFSASLPIFTFEHWVRASILLKWSSVAGFLSTRWAHKMVFLVVGSGFGLGSSGGGEARKRKGGASINGPEHCKIWHGCDLGWGRRGRRGGLGAPIQRWKIQDMWRTNANHFFTFQH